MRVRAFTNRGSTTKVIGKFPSHKNGRSVWWESQIERDFIYLLEFDSEVLSYQEQPLRIQYVRDGRLHKYTPDFLVNRADRKQIIEVKPERKAQELESIVIFRILAAICRREGYEFLVATDTMIRVQPRLNNIKMLWRYSRTPILPQHQIHCHEWLCEQGQIEFLKLIEFLKSKNIEEQVAYALLYRGEIETDLRLPLTRHSIIKLPSGATSN
jgi:hypothetical protein